MQIRRSILNDFSWPLLLLAALTAVFFLTDLDLNIERNFYLSGMGWIYKDSNPWYLLYHYGTYPPLIIFFAAFFALLVSFFSLKVRSYRKIATFFILVMVIGPGLIVNTVFKDNWGRPRPRQVEQFGGNQPFHKVWVKGTSGLGKSFPSGHASAAFYLLSPFFVFRKRSRKIALSFLSGGLLYGVLMGTARMVQGGHFPSDVIWAGGFVYLSGLTLYYMLKMDRDILLRVQRDPPD